VKDDASWHGFFFPKSISLQGFIFALQAILFTVHLIKKEGGRYLLAEWDQENGAIHLDKVLENAFLTGARLPATISTVWIKKHYI